MTDTDQRLRRARAATLASLSAAVLTSLGMPGIGVLLETRTALAILGTVGILAVATTQAAALYAAVTPWTSETTRHRLSIAFAAAAVLSVPLVGPVGADRWDTWAWLGASIAGTAPMLVRPSRAAAIAVATLLVSIGVSWWVDGSPVRSAVIVVGIGLAVAGMCWLPVWLWSLLVDAQAGRTAEERLRFARDVHDLLGHSLSVIAMKAELAGRLAATDAGAAAREAGEVRRLAASALDEMRAAVHGYRTVDLREQIAAIEQVLRSSGVRCDATRSPPATSSETATVLAAVLREATTNLLRHSRATWCRIDITRHGNEVSMTVTNDGATGGGPDRHSSGLRGLADRLAGAGGALRTRPDGDVFVLEATLPAVR